MSKQWTVIEALNWTEERFERHGEENPRLAAQMLASHATGLERIDLYAQFDKPLTEQERTLLRESIQRRLAGEPLQYIIGRVGFRYLELKVRPPVLIPRPETELLVELVLDFARTQNNSMHDAHRSLEQSEKLRVLDLGTGTGAVALSLVHELPCSEVIATDINQDAVALAQENARELKLDDPAVLRIVKDNWASSLLAHDEQRGSFDVLVSNPPYIPTTEYEQLPAEVHEHESKLALDGGPDGLDAFRQIAEQAQTLLTPGGLLAVELHETKLSQAADFVRTLRYSDIALHTDLTGRERFLSALRSHA